MGRMYYYRMLPDIPCCDVDCSLSAQVDGWGSSRARLAPLDSRKAIISALF